MLLLKHKMNISFKKYSVSLFAFFVIFLLVILPALSFAQNNSGTGSPIDNSGTGSPAPNVPSATNADGTLKNPISKVGSIEDFIRLILEGVIKIGMPIIALAIVYSGFLFIAAQGRPEKLKEAKNAILYTLIGATVLLGAWAIAQLIADTVKDLQ